MDEPQIAPKVLERKSPLHRLAELKLPADVFATIISIIADIQDDHQSLIAAEERRKEVNRRRIEKWREHQKRNRNVSRNVTVAVTTPSSFLLKESKKALSAEISEEKKLFDQGRAVLGRNSGGLIKKLIAAKHGNLSQARSALELASTKSEAREFLMGMLRRDANQTEAFFDPKAGIL